MHICDLERNPSILRQTEHTQRRQKLIDPLCIVAHYCNPSIWKDEAEVC